MEIYCVKETMPGSDLYCVEWGIKLYSNQPARFRRFLYCALHHFLISNFSLFWSFYAEWSINGLRICNFLVCMNKNEII